MGLAHTPIDLTKQYKENIYNIALDVSGWDKVTFQVLAPVSGTLAVYGTLNDGMSQGQLYPSNNYGADRARDWTPIQATNLATGTAATTIAAAGLYKVEVNTTYLRLNGGGDVYGLFQFNSKVG
jgi:hypothetical protein